MCFIFGRNFKYNLFFFFSSVVVWPVNLFSVDYSIACTFPIIIGTIEMWEGERKCMSSTAVACRKQASACMRKKKEKKVCNTQCYFNQCSVFRVRCYGTFSLAVRFFFLYFFLSFYSIQISFHLLWNYYILWIGTIMNMFVVISLSLYLSSIVLMSLPRSVIPLQMSLHS